MYLIPLSEHLVETRKCRQCSMDFPITDKDMEFYSKVSPTFGGKKYQIPPPTLCPDCRQQRRLVFRNERKLYKRKCDATGKDIVSIYSPDKPYTVCHQDYWWSDKWDPMEYGREFDFERSAMEQMKELMNKVPKMALIEFNNENSSYSNYVTNCSDVYLSTDIFESSKIIYSSTLKRTHNSLELLDVTDSENTYECVGSERLYNCQYCIWSQDCKDCNYLYACQNVEKSMFCIGLKNKKFHILNREVTENEYNNTRESLQNGQLTRYQDAYKNLLEKHPRKYANMTLCEDATGDILHETKSSKSCFQSTRIENCAYTVVGYDMTDCMDTTIHNPECFLSYEAFSGGKLKNSCSNILVWIGDYILYSDNCFSCSHLFLCTGLRNKSYCILNKQYTKEEYEELVPRIIEKMMRDGEWGEFFPSSLSPFGYNETIANEYFPLEKEEAKILRFNWSDYEAPFPSVSKVIPASKLPDSIERVPDDILNWAIECEVSGKPFRIIKQELEFYRKHSLPIPRRHPDVRHMDRMKMRNPRKLWERLCDCETCEENWKMKGIVLDTTNSAFKDPKTSSGGRRKKMMTTYAPERPERVYCEECYEREVG